MTREEILQIGRKAGALIEIAQEKDLLWLETFAHLVEDKVTARYMQLFLDPENQPTQFGTATQEYREKEIKNEREEFAVHAVDIARRAVAEEREACAKLCESESSNVAEHMFGKECAAAIRARGNT